MKNQKVSVDAWAMVKSMLGYLGVAVLGGILLRLIVATLTLPGRLRKQRADVQRAMEELEKRYPEAFKAAQIEVSNENEEGEVTEEGTEKQEEDEDPGSVMEVTKEEKKIK